MSTGAALSPASGAGTRDAQASERAKRSRTNASSVALSSSLGKASDTEAPPKGINSLPEHLFVDVLALLQTHEIAQAARVSKSWKSVASTPYLWYHLSFISGDEECKGKYAFSVISPTKGTAVPWRKIVERAKGRVLSVELACLSPININKLAEVLLNKASLTLHHVTWSVSDRWGKSKPRLNPNSLSAAGRKVLVLARGCPGLATLEFMCCKSMPNELWARLQIRRFQRFRTNTPVWDDLGTHLSHMLSCAKDVSLGELGLYSGIDEPWLSDFINNNKNLEKLELAFPTEATKSAGNTDLCTSLSLTSLTVRTVYVHGREVMLHAPNLRQLSADARYVSKLSLDTLASLSELQLHVSSKQHMWSYIPVSLRGPPGPSNVEGLQRIRSYTGVMSLQLCCQEREQESHLLAVMADVEPYLTSSEIIWPGLVDVELVMVDPAIADVLRRLIAARTAGSQGASREQYEAIASGTSPANMTFNGPPLCKEVTWHLRCYREFRDQEIITWLREQGDNVRLDLTH